jgi:hypothetical protein
VELPTQAGEHERAVGLARREPLECQLQDRDLVGVDGSHNLPVVGQGRGDESPRVTELGGPPGRVEEGVAKGGVAGLVLGGAEPDREVDAEGRVGVGGLGVEIECVGEVAERVARCERSEGGVAGLAGVVDGLGHVDGLRRVGPVAGELADPAAGPLAAEIFEGFGDLAVGPGAAGGAEVLGEGVLDERVREVVTPGRIGQLAHEGRGRGGVEDVEHLVLGSRSGPGQEIEVEVAADDRRRRQHAFGVRSEPSDARADDHPDAVGQRHLLQGRVRGPTAGRRILSDRAGLGQVAQHLVDEEGVAVGLAIHRMGKADPRVIEVMPGGRFQERDHAGVVEADQLDVGNIVLSVQRGQGVEQRVGAGQLTVAIGPEHEHPHRDIRGDQVAQQLQTGPVGPLEVVEDKHDRLVSRHRRQQADDRGKEHEPLRLGIGRLRRRQIWDSTQQRRHEPDQLRTV